MIIALYGLLFLWALREILADCFRQPRFKFEIALKAIILFGVGGSSSSLLIDCRPHPSPVRVASNALLVKFYQVGTVEPVYLISVFDVLWMAATVAAVAAYLVTTLAWFESTDLFSPAADLLSKDRGCDLRQEPECQRASPQPGSRSSAHLRHVRGADCRQRQCHRSSPRCTRQERLQAQRERELARLGSNYRLQLHHAHSS